MTNLSGNLRVRRIAKTRRGKKIMQSKEPKAQEDLKTALIVKDKDCKQLLGELLQDLNNIRFPKCQVVKKNTKTNMFVEQDCIDNLMHEVDASLFLLGSGNKKNPMALTIGRFFNRSLFDMFKLKINQVKLMKEFAKSKGIMINSRPFLSFSNFDLPEDQLNMDKLLLTRFKNMLIDYFNTGKLDQIVIDEIALVIHFTYYPENKSFSMNTFKLGQSDKSKLTEVGPSMEFNLVDSHLAETDLLREATKRVVTAKPSITKIKNVNTEIDGTVKGRIHMQTQDYTQLKLKKTKAFKPTALKD